MADLVKLVDFIARGLVEAPDEVSVREASADEDGLPVIELQVAQEDRGKVIGKRGRTAHNIRTLLATAHPEGASVQLDIID